jgi:hypothetical protein
MKILDPMLNLMSRYSDENTQELSRFWEQESSTKVPWLRSSFQCCLHLQEVRQETLRSMSHGTSEKWYQ